MNANNVVVLTGRLTKPAELQYTPNGVAVARFSLAINRPFAEEGQQQADFPNCVVWRKYAESLANYCDKGSLISLVGSIQTRNYEDNSGKKVYVTEVVANDIRFLDSKKNSDSQGRGSTNTNTQGSGQRQTQQEPDPYGGFGGSVDDDPFKDDGIPMDISDADLPWINR